MHFNSDLKEETGNEETGRAKIEWTFETLLNSDLIFFNFDPSNPDPETLFNFGILSTSFAWNKRRVCFVVCCPKEYPYSLNIEFVCKNNP